MQPRFEQSHNYSWSFGKVQTSRLCWKFKDYCDYLLVDVAVRRAVIDEDADDVHVPAPRSQV